MKTDFLDQPIEIGDRILCARGDMLERCEVVGFVDSTIVTMLWDYNENRAKEEIVNRFSVVKMSWEYSGESK
jgi:hypothetical protein